MQKKIYIIKKANNSNSEENERTEERGNKTVKGKGRKQKVM